MSEKSGKSPAGIFQGAAGVSNYRWNTVLSNSGTDTVVTVSSKYSYGMTRIRSLSAPPMVAKLP